MTARTIIRSTATAALGVGLLLAGTSTAHAAPHATTATKGTAFVTADGKVACAYNTRGTPHTECVNTTSGWSHLKHGSLRDVDGNLIADHPFVADVSNKSGIGAPGVSTQGPTYDSVAAQKWHAKNGPVKHVRITTNGYGDYVNQDFAVLQKGQKVTFPDGINFSADDATSVMVTTHLTPGSNFFSTLSATGYGPSDN